MIATKAYVEELVAEEAMNVDLKVSDMERRIRSEMSEVRIWTEGLLVQHEKRMEDDYVSLVRRIIALGAAMGLEYYHTPAKNEYVKKVKK